MNIRLDNFLQTQTYATLRYIVINSIFVACIYFGLFHEVEGISEGALNIALVMAWITSILGVVVLLGFAVNEKEMTDKIAEEIERKGAKFGTPKWMDVAFDIGVAFAFLWTGYIFLSIFYTMHIYGGLKIRNAREMSMFNALKYGVKNDER